MAAMVGKLFWARLNRNASHLITRNAANFTDLVENMDKKDTWDRFYLQSSSVKDGIKVFKNFEWFFGFDVVRNHIVPLLQSRSPSVQHVLDAGCGTSALGLSIYTHSPWPVQVTCADISTVALQLMEEHVKSKCIQPLNGKSHLAFMELDCCSLYPTFGLQSLNVIVDKGTSDALLKSKHGQGKAVTFLQQCLKVLHPSGSLVQFSDEDPDVRLIWLENNMQGQAKVTVQEVGIVQGISYYCYLINFP